jgi:hypothetical protein
MRNKGNDGLYWEDEVITEVSEGDTYYSIGMGSSFFGIDKKWGKIPKVGDKVRIGTKGIGSTIRAVFLNGEKVYHKTEADIDREHKEWVDAENVKKETAFTENKTKMDAEFDALPKIFQLRISRFRNGNARFRIEYEPYELFVCQEAIKIAEHCKTGEKVKEFAKLPYKEQEEVISNQHSGNTMGCAMRLAYLYLTNPEHIVYEHGALVPLVGCEAYGCTHGG